MSTQKIFFSYSRADSPFALTLAKDLREAGADIWIDQLDIPAGSHWDLVPFDDLDAETQAYDTFTFKMAPVIAHLNKKRILKRKV